jgi:hypothetical protein
MQRRVERTIIKRRTMPLPDSLVLKAISDTTIPPLLPVFDPMPWHAGFVMNKMALVASFLITRVFRFPLAVTFPQTALQLSCAIQH